MSMTETNGIALAADKTEQRRPYILHLRIRAADGKRDALIAFLREAVPYYEEPGGISIRLLQDCNDPDSFVEIAEYESRAAYEYDAARVESDPRMRAYIERWRSLLAGPPVVEVFTELTDNIRDRHPDRVSS